MTDDDRFPVEIAGGVLVVAAPEELDLINAPQLEPVLAAASAAARGWFVVDMSRTRFCDVAGLRVLITAHERARADGGGLVLAIGGKAVPRLLEITGAGGLVPCFTTLEEAFAHVAAGDGHRAGADGVRRLRSQDGLAAGDGDPGPGDVAGLIGGEQHVGGRDLDGLAGAVEGG
jgi:anti-anti-sigma factor